MDKCNIYLFVLLILSLVVTVTVTSALMLVKKANNQEFKTSALMLVKKANNQEFKERTLILFMEHKGEDGTLYKEQITIVQLSKTKIKIEMCDFINDFKTECMYVYPDYNNEGKGYIDFLDELKIPPGETIINLMEEPEIAEKFFSH